MLEIRQTNSGKRIILTCDHIIGYMTKCNNCGEQIQTENNVKLSDCYKCKSKNLDKAIAVKCTEQERIEMGTLDSKKKHNDWDKRIDDIIKTIPGYKKGADYYCPKHAGLHNG